MTPEQVRAALEAKAAGTLATTAMLYSHRDIYELLVFRSYGTPYEHFLDWLVDEEDRTTLRVLELIHGAEKARTVISKESLHIVNHAFYSALSENIIHAKSVEELNATTEVIFNVLQCGLGEISHALTALSFFASKITKSLLTETILEVVPMAETSEQDRQRDEAGREAIRRLSCPVKGRVMLAQAFTVLSALLSFAPYLALVWLGDLFLAGEGPLAQADASKVHEIALLLVMAFLSQLFFRALALIITHFADMKLRYVIRKGYR